MKKLCVALVIGVLVAGCGSIISSVSEDLAGDLSAAILQNPDIDTVREGAPAFLLLIDGLLERAPDNPALLSQAALLNGAYASAFVADPERARLMSAKARGLAERAACQGLTDACGITRQPFVAFERWVLGLEAADVPLAYGLATAWTGWMQAHSDDFGAIAELGKVKRLMQRIAELNESHDYGGPHLYLGVFETLLPAALGGRPELGRYHFERALALSEGRYLMVQVLFAESYARLVYDRALHDELLNQALMTAQDVPELTLMNTVARRRAQQLLDSADAWF